jgi:DNA-directed RNA polymerase subunit beta'
MTKKEISNMIDAVYRHCGQKETVIFCDRIMALGFTTRSRPASRSARTTWSIPTPREDRRRYPQLAKDYEQQYNDGLITQGEKYNKVVDAWAKCTDRVAEEMMKRISAVEKDRTAARSR